MQSKASAAPRRSPIELSAQQLARRREHQYKPLTTSMGDDDFRLSMLAIISSSLLDYAAMAYNASLAPIIRFHYFPSSASFSSLALGCLPD